MKSFLNIVPTEYFKTITYITTENNYLALSMLPHVPESVGSYTIGRWSKLLIFLWLESLYILLLKKHLSVIRIVLFSVACY